MRGVIFRLAQKHPVIQIKILIIKSKIFATFTKRTSINPSYFVIKRWL